ncbi:hypothetical protein ABEG63_17755 [Chryseobacterium sp. C39-AII1]|uniref:hypothetical protein n=1 Tax=Chryseobacterium sp. C39-AII1 TaxID=3080332 RepID=UPI003208022A
MDSQIEYHPFNIDLGAISYYEKQMQQRTSKVTEDTLKNTAFLHSENALNLMLSMMKGKEF